MRNGLYPKLAWQNIRQNRRFFVPYLLALIGLSAAFYVMSALVLDPGVDSMRGAEYVKVMMGMSCSSRASCPRCCCCISTAFS